MADTSIDPKTVEAMKIFRMETDKVNDKFKKLEQHMSKFSRDINMANVRTVDFAKSWKAMSKIDAFADANKSLSQMNQGMKEFHAVRKKGEKADSLSQMNQGMKEFHAVRKKGGEARPAPAPTETAQPEQGSKVEIGTLRIDVSGVTDKTDKEKLARDISQRVTRTLKTQTGGPVSSGGYNRGL